MLDSHEVPTACDLNVNSYSTEDKAPISGEEMSSLSAEDDLFH